MRYLIADTETTGLEVEKGHRLIEIGLVEVENFRLTSRQYQSYINPERAIDGESFRVHGISAEFLADKPRFKQVADELMDFIGEDQIVAHNAGFDLKFINAELTQANRPPLPAERFIDSMELARQKFPGSMVNLDALCRRLKIDNTDRQLHGALKDAVLLAKVWIELLGGGQGKLDLEEVDQEAIRRSALVGENKRPRREPRIMPASPEELAAHAAMLEKLKNPIWTS